MEKQLVGFFRGRLAVVTRHGDPHIAGKNTTAHLIHLAHHGIHHVHRIGPGLLGHAQGDRRLDPLPPLGLKHVGPRFLGSVDNLRHIAQINRPSLVNPHHHLSGLGRAGDESAGLDENRAVFGGDRPRPRLPVALLQHRHNACGRHPAGRQAHRIEEHTDLPTQPADHTRLRHQGNLLHRILQFRRQPPQFHRILPRTMQSQGQNGHVIDGPRLDQRRRHPVRDAVEIRLQLLVEFDQTRLQVGADFETHDDQTLGRTRRGVDVFDPGDFPEQLLHRSRHPLRHLARAGARHRHHHVDHRHLDLRFFLPREQNDRGQTEQDGRHDEQRRQLAVDKHPRNPSGQAVRYLLHLAQARLGHGAASTETPSVKRCASRTTTDSPPDKPLKISISPFI